MGSVVTLVNKWAKLGEALAPRARDVVAQAAADAFDFSQSVVAVDSGDLKASGRVDTDSDGLTAYLVYGTDHAWYVEFGTRNMAAQPYIMPSIQYVRDNWRDYLSQILDASNL